MLPLKVAGLSVGFPEKRETVTDFIGRGIPQKAIERFGIFERRIVEKGQKMADMELEVSRDAIKKAGLKAADIDLIISTNMLPEMIGIPNSNLLQYRLGAKKAASFDIVQACGAVIPGMIISANFLALKQYKAILFTASTNWSRIANPAHPSTDFVLGDGAGAMVLVESDPSLGIISFEMHTNGEFFYNCGTRVGNDCSINYFDRHDGKLLFFIDKGVEDDSISEFKQYISSNGPAAFRAALKKARLSPRDIDCAIIHGNIKLVTEAWINNMMVPQERFPLTYSRYGNLNMVTLLANLQEGLDKGMVKSGSTVAFVGQGAGFTAGSIIMKW